MFVSDQGSHFKNHVLAQLETFLQIRHHFTTALIHFSNGTVEHLNRDIFEAFRIQLRELNLKQTFWALLLPVIQNILNHAPKESLAGSTAAYQFGGFIENGS